MKKSKLIKMATVLFCIVGISSIIFLNKSIQPTKETDHFSEKINESDIFLKIAQSLYERGYSFGIEHDILSNKNVEVIVKIPSEEVNEDTKKAIQQIVTGVIKTNNFDPELFQINVTNYTKTSN